MVTILGPAGIGKSRLARRLIGAVESDATVLTGRCLAYGSGAFWPLAEMVKQAAGDTTPEALLQLLADLEDRQSVVDQLGGGARDGLGDARGGCVLGLSQALWRARGRSAARPGVRGSALGRGPAARLRGGTGGTDRGRGPPCCLSGSPRSARTEAWLGRRKAGCGGDSACAAVRLEQRGVDPGLGAAEETRGQIVARAEGNPLFAEQLVALAAEEPDALSDAIPFSINAVLAARIDRLRVDERSLLESASIVGLEFSSSAVAALAASDEDLAAVARRLARKDLLRPA